MFMTMSPLSPIVEDLVIVLNQEMLDMERNKRRLLEGQRLASDNCRQHKRYYAYLLKKQQLFIKHKEAQREELYSMEASDSTDLLLSTYLPLRTSADSNPLTDAVMAGDAARIKKVEAKMLTSDTQAQEVQLQIPNRLKHFAEAIKREQEYDEAIRHIRHKMSLKSEEIHKYQPCETFLCEHCRGGTEKRLRKQEKRRYREEIEGSYEEDQQQPQGMMSRIVRKVKSFSL